MMCVFNATDTAAVYPETYRDIINAAYALALYLRKQPPSRKHPETEHHRSHPENPSNYLEHHKNHPEPTRSNHTEHPSNLTIPLRPSSRHTTSLLHDTLLYIPNIQETLFSEAVRSKDKLQLEHQL